MWTASSFVGSKVILIVIKQLIKHMLISFRSKSFKEGGESFFLVALVNNVGQHVTEGSDGLRHM